MCVRGWYAIRSHVGITVYFEDNLHTFGKYLIRNGVRFHSSAFFVLVFDERKTINARNNKPNT